ncbi:MAG: ATP-dependent DNA helicase RecG, partial [Actinomycetota bacterium]
MSSPSIPLTLASPVEQIDRRLATRRTGRSTKGPEARAVLADAFGIETVGQLVHHYPRRYIDRSRVATIRGLKLGEEATVIATVHSVDKRMAQRNRKMTIVTVRIGDGTGYLALTFFNQPWLATTYRKGMELAVSGIAQSYRGSLQMANQEVEILRGEPDELVHTGRITPVHPAADGIAPKTIRELLYRAFERLAPQPDPLPAELVRAERLAAWDAAVRTIHFPADDAELAAARERLKFDELFTLELGVGYRKQRVEAERKGVAHTPEGELTRRLRATVPFTPTAAQDRAMQEVGHAMAAAQPMNLLLQGDVGAGKTLVALHACLVAIQSGHQAAIMAPTEVLAGQHARSVATLLAGVGGVSYLELTAPPRKGTADAQASLFGGGAPDDPDGPEAPDVDADLPRVTYANLTGSVTGKDRERVLAGIAEGAVDLVVGTHALVQEGVAFRDLSLAVVDEQHRFGLHQRMALKGKGGGDIDVLIMTATPIPRTLALTYYGDLDVVVLDELPAGRQPIETRAVRTEDGRRRAEDLVRDEVAAGRQAFVVCAAIDEGNRTQVKAAEAEAERLRTAVFPDLRVELLHGRMRPKDKDRIMETFRAGEADILISTTVIEVGVDVPNATVMLVENAERFGLAQLHQL